MHVLHVVGARPNFMKVAPVMAAFEYYGSVAQTLVHTGQHYDHNMSEVFFRQLGIPEPNINLGVGSAGHASQTAQIMLQFESVVDSNPPDLVLVYGDVNSTVAAALVCAKLLIPVGHVEAGLRSRDRTMPEEINRVVTDQLSSLLFTPSSDGNENLAKEGIPADRVHLVGNVMIDTLIRLLPQAQAAAPGDIPERFVLVTLHRPSNVDEPTMIHQIMRALVNISHKLPVLFPVHPRTRQRLACCGLVPMSYTDLHLLDPIGYIEFLALQLRAALVITDSGGIQEETTFLGIPCLTVRKNTERPITVSLGTNVLVGQDMMRLEREVDRVLNGCFKTGTTPPLWDGKAGERIAQIVVTGGAA